MATNLLRRHQRRSAAPGFMTATLAPTLLASLLLCQACTAKPPDGAAPTQATSPAITSPAAPPSPATTTSSTMQALARPDHHPVRLSLGQPITGFDRPVHVANAADGSGRLFVVEQGGTVRVVVDGVIQAGPFLDVTSILGGQGGEQGLLGLAFHPGFKTNRRLFVAYTGADGDNVVAEFKANAAGAVVAGPPRVLLAIKDFASNHNGGHVLFGPDGQLWVGTGDGGGGGDPQRTAQDPEQRLGKMLRIDVDSAGAPVTTWARGLRNPWRYAFDAATGDLWIADVGQNAWEEVNVVPRALTATALNFGWSVMEGRECFRPERGCDQAGFVLPVFVYPHDRKNGCSVTGGVVVNGTFFFSDYCSGRVWAIRRTGAETSVAVVAETDRRVSSFGVGEDGRAWLVDHGGAIVPLVITAAQTEAATRTP